MSLCLDTDPELIVVGQAATMTRALYAIPAAAPDAVVLGVRLPDGDGIDLCRILTSRVGGPRCVILTVHADESTRRAAESAGAAGYLVKNITVDLPASVKQAMRKTIGRAPTRQTGRSISYRLQGFGPADHEHCSLTSVPSSKYYEITPPKSGARHRDRYS
ncbi:Transcriptional regulatory protein DevR (DosR) [Nocardia seriolae]|uniref:Transcriptional regulatory protein DevR (DosR) n=1 Tax=Nocardia seriolae TaxID=37332 RepID=A0ABC8AUT0_9NOCA|nr:Transcriptional regulatory protein DevR (DosR) [Nocardia seriolae]